MAFPAVYALDRKEIITAPCPKFTPPLLMTFDTLVSITSLVVAILGLTSVIGLSPAASYALVGVSAAITVVWICFGIYKNCIEEEMEEDLLEDIHSSEFTGY